MLGTTSGTTVFDVGKNLGYSSDVRCVGRPVRTDRPGSDRQWRARVIRAISLSEKATIHSENMASNYGCSWTCQKENCGGDFIRLGKAA